MNRLMDKLAGPSALAAEVLLVLLLWAVVLGAVLGAAFGILKLVWWLI